MPASEIRVPPTGPVILSDGQVLVHNNLSVTKSRGPGWYDLPIAEKNERVVRSAARDGSILCLRPRGSRYPAKFGLTLQEALDYVAVDGLRGMIAVDPYDADGEPITMDGEPLTKWAALPTPEHP